MHEVDRRKASPDLAAAAYHEAAHAVATVIAFRTARWLPHPAPPLPVRVVEITQDASGYWIGNCTSSDIYSVTWQCVTEQYRPLMQAQVTIHLAGGIAEAAHRNGLRNTLAFAKANCCMDHDLTQAHLVLGDLHILDGLPHDEGFYANRTLELLLDNWSAVHGLASALIEDRRIEGERVAQIIDRSLRTTTADRFFRMA
jgi:hypothetical protein